MHGEDGAPTWLRVPNNKGYYSNGNASLGAGVGKGIKKKYTFGVFPFFFLPLYTVSLNISLHFHTSLSNKASGHHNTHFSSLTIHNPSHQHWCTRLCKNFSVTLLFLNLSQYKPCSKCYEKMYMFIQGRLWQDTGLSLLGWPQEGAGVSDVCLCLLPPPFPPSPPGTSSALPLVSARTPPLFLGEIAS